MRYNILSILFGLFLVFLFVTCEEVEEPFIEGNPYTGEYDSNLPIRKILVEDFTGWACNNCPRANEEIHKLQDRYGSHVVPVSIHSGFFANTFFQGGPDFTTDVGLELGGDGLVYGYFNIQNQPIGVINRKLFNETNEVFTHEYETWSSRIVDILSVSKFADIDINIDNEYEDETKSFTVDINIKAINAVASRLTLSVYLVENGIIEKQKDGSETIEEYEHNHMLRKGINGTWGDEISTIIPFEAGEELSYTYTDTISNEWNASNCEIVAFVYDSETLEVIQAEQAPVISE